MPAIHMPRWASRLTLIVTGTSRGATAPYLALKMCYLALYPLSVAARTLERKAHAGR